jgi:potassium-transporting ATPase KdpC subunit
MKHLAMKQLRPALLLTLFFVVTTGLAFPGAIWGIGQVAFSDQANGSLIRDERGDIVGSSLIGQSFSQPQYFHPRPSAAGSGYDAASSSGTNLGPTSAKLVNGIKDDPATADVDETYLGFRDLAKAYREENGLAPDARIPADAATRSASGLDPDISIANAELQLARVAKARNARVDDVRQLAVENSRGPLLGVLGEPRVNVLGLNLALDRLE